MKKNVGSLDKLLRMVVGVVFAILFALKVVTGTLGLTLLIVGIILFLTGFINFCPLYSLLKISTRTESKNKEN